MVFNPILSKIQADIEELNLERQRREPHLLAYSEVANQIYVDFYCDPMAEFFEKFLLAICTPEVSSKLHTLNLRGHNSGANGTSSWNFSSLLKTSATFPNLERFAVALCDELNTNRPIIEDTRLKENGVIAKIAARCPQLKYLYVPSAPNEDFFQLKHAQLKVLRVRAGYDHQRFIYNLSKSGAFPALWTLDFQDFSETYIENYKDGCTSFVDYEALFKSQIFNSLYRFVLRESLLKEEEISYLRALRPDLKFHLINTQSR